MAVHSSAGPTVLHWLELPGEASLDLLLQAGEGSLDLLLQAGEG